MRWRVRHFINLHKGLVIPVVIGLMWYFDEWGTTAFVYLGLHGSYSILWLLKEATFRDRRFEQDIPLLIGVLFVFVPLASYYAAPYIIAARHVQAESWLLGTAVGVSIVGVFLHYVSDAQKHAALRQRRELIVDGLFARTRNPNYLGEMLIYSGFALLAKHWLPWVVLLAWWAFFVRNMHQKDTSISRYPGFPAYKERSWLLLPKLWR